MTAMIRLAAVLLLFFPISMLPRSLNAQTVGIPADTLPMQPGDVVEVTIWGQEFVTGQFPIDANGVVTLPILGERQVAGVRPEQLRDQLTAEYRSHLNNPAILVMPRRRAYVLGAVNKPGEYTVDPTTTVMSLIAQAEGVTSGGDLKNVRLERGGEVVRKKLPPDAWVASIDFRSGDQIIVGPRSWFARNRSFIISALFSLPGVIYTITRIN